MADFEKIIGEYADTDGNIPKAAIGTVITAIKQAVGNEFVDKSRYKAKLDEIDELKTAKQTAEDTATTAGKWETKYKELKKDFDDYKTAQNVKETRATKTELYKKLLTECGFDIEEKQKVIIKASQKEIDDMKLNSDGNVEGVEQLKESIIAEYGGLLSHVTRTGADIQKPAVSGAIGSSMTVDDIMKISDPTARQMAIAQNSDLFT